MFSEFAEQRLWECSILNKGYNGFFYLSFEKAPEMFSYGLPLAFVTFC